MKLKKIITITITLLLIIFFSLLYPIVNFKNINLTAKSDVILVLGHSLEDTGTPSRFLTLRLTDALFLYNNNYSEKIIVSGGKGPTDNIPVSDAMKDWLIDNGVSENDIIVENKASNTYENFKYTKEITTKENFKSIIIVTNDFHMYRSVLISKQFYDTDAVQYYSSGVDFNFNKALAYIKEPFSVIKYYLFNY